MVVELESVDIDTLINYSQCQVKHLFIKPQPYVMPLIIKPNVLVNCNSLFPYGTLTLYLFLLRSSLSHSRLLSTWAPASRCQPVIHSPTSFVLLQSTCLGQCSMLSNQTLTYSNPRGLYLNKIIKRTLSGMNKTKEILAPKYSTT